MKKRFDPELWLFRIFMLVFLTGMTFYLWNKANEIEHPTTIRSDEIINPILVVWEVDNEGR